MDDPLTLYPNQVLAVVSDLNYAIKQAQNDLTKFGYTKEESQDLIKNILTSKINEAFNSRQE